MYCTVLSVVRFYYARATPRPGAATPPGYSSSASPRYTSLEECLQYQDPECIFLTGHHYDLTIPYFCGHEDFCRWILLPTWYEFILFWLTFFPHNVISWLFYWYESLKYYNFFFPYFCRELNNEAALRLAKKHVEEWYPVVGVLEEVNATLAVLQHHLPHYFAGVLELYHNELLGNSENGPAEWKILLWLT